MCLTQLLMWEAKSAGISKDACSCRVLPDVGSVCHAVSFALHVKQKVACRAFAGGARTFAGMNTIMGCSSFNPGD